MTPEIFIGPMGATGALGLAYVAWKYRRARLPMILACWEFKLCYWSLRLRMRMHRAINRARARWGTSGKKVANPPHDPLPDHVTKLNPTFMGVMGATGAISPSAYGATARRW